jgi:hypothetical protein
MREVIFEGLKWCITPLVTTANSDKNEEGKKEGLRKTKGRYVLE